MVYDVGVIGAGASGVLASAHLSANGAGEIALVGRAENFGKGIAYETLNPEHLLNVRAQGMSAWPDKPGDFVDWLSASGEAYLPTDFVPRYLYAEYLAGLVPENATMVYGEARSVERQGENFVIRGDDAIECRALVVATGNLPPSVPTVFQSVVNQEKFAANPWLPFVCAPDDRVGIIGTGLTAVDTILTLKSNGHRGFVSAFSRHGLLPLSHRDPLPAVDPTIWLGNRDLSSILHDLRSKSREVEEWRTVVDGMRSVTNTLWTHFSERDRERFTRRLQTFWDVHRHRIAPVIASKLASWLSEGSLTVGPFRTATSSWDGAFCLSTVGGESVSFDVLINCTGPKSDLRCAKVSILESLTGQNLATYHASGLGLDVTETGQVDHEGRVFALGPICRGRRWETTAVPEIRAQAQALARAICG